MVGCSIRKCKSRSVRGGEVRFFSFPKERSLAYKWLRYCKANTTTKFGRVCSLHFGPKDIDKNLSMSGRNLKPDAVPNLLIDDDNVYIVPDAEFDVPIVKDHRFVDRGINCDGLRIVPIEFVDEETNPDAIPPTFIVDGHEDNRNNPVEIAGCMKSDKKRNSKDNQVDKVTISVSEYKILTTTLTKYNNLKNNLRRILTPDQMRSLMKPVNP